MQAGTDSGGPVQTHSRMRRRTHSRTGGRRTAAALVVTTALALMALTGCGDYNDERGKGDAPVAGRHGEDSAAEVFTFPDGFGNVATKCVGHGFRAYVTTNDSAPSNLQVVADKTCGGSR